MLALFGMENRKIVFAVVAILIVAIAIAAIAFTHSKSSPDNVKVVTGKEPILVYAGGLPYTLYNLSFSDQNISVVQNRNQTNFSYGNFKPGSLIDSVMVVGSFNSIVPNISLLYSLSSPRLELSGINYSFGNGSLKMPLIYNTLLYNGIVLGLRLFPLEYYSTSPGIVLKSALYPEYYNGTSKINSSIKNAIEYNISAQVPIEAKFNNGTISFSVHNNGNSTLMLEDFELSGYFLGSMNASPSLPKIVLQKPNIDYIIERMEPEGINISNNDTMEFLETNKTALQAFENRAKSGLITNASEFYSYFNTTLNITRLEYLEDIISENKSYGIAMSSLNNFNPYNSSVQEFAARISAWSNAYLGILDFNVSKNGTLEMPKSEIATNSTGDYINPGSNKSFAFKIRNVNYLGQRTYFINNTNYTIFAYFKGISYSYYKYRYK